MKVCGGVHVLWLSVWLLAPALGYADTFSCLLHGSVDDVPTCSGGLDACGMLSADR